MIDNQAECIQRIKALVFFAEYDEEPFLEESVPMWLKLYPAAELFLHFTHAPFLDFDASTLAGDPSQAHRVHIIMSSCQVPASGLPSGSKAVLEVLEAVTAASACTGALSTDYILRVPPFIVPMRTEYIAQAITQDAVFAISYGGTSPMAIAPYLFTVELWHRVMRVVSLMNVVGLTNGYADLYIQSMAFALAHSEPFLYVRDQVNVGNVMHHVFNYEQAENPNYINGVVPLAGYINMRADVDRDMKEVTHWTRKLAPMVFSFNNATS